MKPIGNIAGHADLSKPLTEKKVKKALRRAQAAQRPTVDDALAAGYKLTYIAPSQVARACAAITGRLDRAIPQFVKSH